MTQITSPAAALAASARAIAQIEPARQSHAVAIKKAENILKQVPADHPLAIEAVKLIRGRAEEMGHQTRIAELRKVQAELQIRFTIAMDESLARTLSD
jgi:hypothetical protein